MYEIELKAHVDDRKSVIKNLERFANFAGAVEKDDTYYSIDKDGKELRCRIRKETPFTTTEVIDAPQIDSQKSVIFTYKRKEIRTEDGKAMEVNDEKEMFLSDAEPFEDFLADTGYKPCLTKHKVVLAWQYDGALFELCTVPPLGNFLEIEIMSKSNDEQQVSATRTKLLSLLAKCGISEDKIEERYYSDMLEELKK